MSGIEYSDENKVEFTPDEKHTPTPPPPATPLEVLELQNQNPLAEEEAVEEDDRGHE